VRAFILGTASSVLLAASGAQAGTDRAVPLLRITSDRPFVVVGTGFRSDERVRLLVTAPEPATRTVRASASGRFRIVLGVALGRCGGVVVQALGRRGSRATVDRAGPDCAPID
jgi:hypothetical protein